MNKLIDELEAAAKKATQGEWKLETSEFDDGFSDVGPIKSCDGCMIATKNDGEYVSLANPENILKLCAMVREAEKAIKSAYDCEWGEESKASNILHQAIQKWGEGQK